MEAEQAIRITDRILSFLTKLKCKMVCCCKSSCALDGTEPETLEAETQTELTNIAEL
jgi:hypothetical protein